MSFFNYYHNSAFQRQKVAAIIIIIIMIKKLMREELFALSYCSFCFADIGYSLFSEFPHPFHNPLVSRNSSYFAKRSA